MKQINFVVQSQRKCSLRSELFAVVVLLSAWVLSGCGGGGGDAKEDPTYTIGGNVSGLTGSGLTIQNNGGGNTPIAANGPYNVITTQRSGSTYAVTISAQPTNPAQVCTVANGSGTVASSNVISVAITCVNATYTVGGSVTGLSGTGLVLQNNGGDNLAVNTNGAFLFATAVNNGNYNVTVRSQPNSPVQRCTVASGSGTSTGINIGNVAVTCTTTVPRNAYTWNGTSGSLSLYYVDPSNGELRSRGYYKVGTTPISTIDVNSATDTNLVFSYTLNQGSMDITAGVTNKTTNVFSIITGSPFSVGATPSAIVGHPSGKFLYVMHEASNAISAYSVNGATGTLTAVPGSPFAAGTGPQYPGILGGFMYVANKVSNNIYVYGIDATTGALTEVTANRIATGTAPLNLSFRSNAAFAYVANSGSANISGYAVNATTGVLTPVAGSPFASGTTPALVMSPNNNRIFYSLNLGSDNISGYSVDATTGVLTQLNGSPFATDVHPFNVAFDGSGRYFYVGNGLVASPSSSAPGSISTFNVDAITGALTSSGSSIAAAPWPRVTADPSGKYIYVVSTPTNAIHSYGINQSNGTLSRLTNAPIVATGTQPFFGFVASGTAPIVTVPKYMYVANDGGTGNGTLTSYSIAPASGILTAVGTPQATRVSPESVAVPAASPFAARYVYVANGVSNSISAFSSTNGVLNAVAGSPFVTTPVAPHFITTDSAGRFAYVAHDAVISMYSINASTGALTVIAPAIAAGSYPETITLDMNARCAFAPNNGSNNVSAYSINPNTGALTSVGGTPIATGPFPVAASVDPTGRFLYVTNDGDNTISAYSIAATTCALSAITGSPFPAGSGANGLITLSIELSGKFLYTGNEANGNVSMQAINQSSGALTAISAPISAGVSVAQVNADPSGKFLYVTSVPTQSGAKSINTYSINSSTGALTALTGGTLAAPSVNANAIYGDTQ